MPTLRDILQGSLEPSEQEVQAALARLDDDAATLGLRFDAIEAEFEAQDRLVAALAPLPAGRRQGWLTGLQASLAVKLSQARRGSQLLRDAALDLLPVAADGWDLSPAFAGAVRGGDGGQLQAAGPAGTLRVAADDSGAVRRILVTVTGYPSGRPAPVLLIIPQDSVASEEDADIEAGPESSTLRWRIALPPGPYQLLLGNPRGGEAADDNA